MILSRKPGRPSKPEAEKLCVKLMMAVTIEEAAVIYKQASLVGMTISAYLRAVNTSAVVKVTGDKVIPD